MISFYIYEVDVYGSEDNLILEKEKDNFVKIMTFDTLDTNNKQVRVVDLKFFLEI